MVRQTKGQMAGLFPVECWSLNDEDVVSRLDRTRPGYLRTSGDLAREGRVCGLEGMENVKKRYEDAKEKFEEQKQ